MVDGDAGRGVTGEHGHGELGIPNGPVVVGFDGSAPSRTGLVWACRQAALMGVPLEVVTTYELPANYGWAVAMPPDIDLQSDMAQMVSGAVAELPVDLRTQVEIVTKVIEGHAATVLVDQSAHASVLVVGIRGLGSFAGMLLGSVSAHLSSHSHCPVVIIPCHHHHGAAKGTNFEHD